MSKEPGILQGIEYAMNNQPISRMEQFDVACSIGRNIFKRKNQEYGDAIIETGVLGPCIEMVGICARLRKLVLQENFSNPDSKALLVDLFLDMHNYADIALIMLGENNLRGK